MLNPSAYALGANRSCIRDLFEYGCQRAAVVGRENIYDYSLGNPSSPCRRRWTRRCAKSSTTPIPC